MNQHYLVIDYSTGRVYRFQSALPDADEAVEKWAKAHGVRIKDCEWMATPENFTVETTEDVV